MQLLANVLIDGVAYGMVLFIIAVGLSVTLGLMRFVNLSHGAFAMIGGYAAALLTREAGWSFWLAVPVAIVATGLLGAVLEALVLRHLYRRSELDQVLFTIGLSFFLIAATNALAAGSFDHLVDHEHAVPGADRRIVGNGIRVALFQRLDELAVGRRVMPG
ncbi:MAG: branched-chain amino acid ABC transporter permease, partial [Ideonella sp.]|nr:branched-chain amino acid ABC transporter permease [Ideonella sp.]